MMGTEQEIESLTANPFAKQQTKCGFSVSIRTAAFCLLAAMNLGLIMTLYFRETAETFSDTARSEAKSSLDPSDSHYRTACEIAPHRCSSFVNDKVFGFIHIAKTAGASWIHELKAVFPRVQPDREGGQEWSVAWQRQNLPSTYLATSVKSPRHHIWSQFAECKYSYWGKKTTKESDFPRSGNTAESDIIDFNRWLTHFVSGLPAPAEQYYNCYDPSNFISQYLTSTKQLPRGHHPTVSPDLTLANRTLWDLNFVALPEFFHEGKCLLFQRIQNRSTSVQAYLDTECVCPIPRSIEDAHRTHHSYGRRPILRDLSQETLRAVEWLSQVDMVIYKTALEQFFREILWLETEQLGRRVLCQSSLEKWELELAYLGVNVTERYHELARAASKRQHRRAL